MTPSSRTGKRVFVLGLDCATPQLLFEEYREHLPNFRRLMEEGAWGRLKSSDPPITVPAWTCMFSSRDPGELGFYGFRNRADHGYENMVLANSRAVRHKRAWEYASEAGLDVVVLGVPQTYPPTPVKGVMVASFMTPSKESTFTYPPLLKWELDRLAGGEDGYVIDVEDFRTDDKQKLRAAIESMTRKRFQVARALCDQKPWSLFAMVEMGPDRMHHGFWRYADRTHRLFEAGNPFEHVLRDYYRLLDDELGALLAKIPEDASLFVVSDHGARGLEGGICINEWLIREGLLAVKKVPEKIGSLKYDNVDWERTKVWGEGGYYGRVFLNVEGREPKGTIPSRDYEAFRDEIAARIAAIPDASGQPIGTVVLKPEKIYREVQGVAPDLIVYFGNLAWRSVGSLGHGAIHTFSNDTGPDDANHDHHGVFLARDAALAGRGRLEGISLYDMLPTILDRLAIEIPPGLVGKTIR
jgi:predicted AlkP superfamily phosphohydrolase/phosphomutase